MLGYMSSEAPRQCELCEELVPPKAAFCPICGTASPTDEPKDDSEPDTSESPSEAPEPEEKSASTEPDEEERAEEEVEASDDETTDDEASDEEEPEPAADTEEPDEEALGEAEPEAGDALVLDWEKDFLRLVEKAADMEGLTLEAFVRDAVEDEVKRLLAPPKTLLDLDNAAHALGIPRSDVVKRISEGRLKAKKIDGKWMVQIEGGVGVLKKKEDPNKAIMRELEAMVRDAGLNGVETEGDVPDSVSMTWCFVNQ